MGLLPLKRRRHHTYRHLDQRRRVRGDGYSQRLFQRLRPFRSHPAHAIRLGQFYEVGVVEFGADYAAIEAVDLVA